MVTALVIAGLAVVYGRYVWHLARLGWPKEMPTATPVLRLVHRGDRIARAIEGS